MSLLLVVDDQVDNVAILSKILQRAGYEVQMAVNGKEALETVEQRRPDLILMDIMMPEMDGFVACQKLKENPETADIPVIFVSALDATTDIVKAFEVGGVDYLTKPYQRAEILARIRTHLMLAEQRREIEALREQDRRYFEKLDETKNTYMSSVAHDLKNPISVVLGYSALLKDYPAIHTDPMIMSHIERIERASKNALNLVGDVLDLARIETGFNLKPVKTELHQVLQETYEEVIMLAKQKAVAFSLHLPQENPTLRVDTSQIYRAITNLLSNAIKYTPEGGRVDFSGYIVGERVQIEVKDTGLGIPEADLPRLFEKFFRVEEDAHLSVEGTGLGLSIVKAVMDHHEGEITVTSELGQGSTFSLFLPITA